MQGVENKLFIMFSCNCSSSWFVFTFFFLPTTRLVRGFYSFIPCHCGTRAFCIHLTENEQKDLNLKKKPMWSFSIKTRTLSLKSLTNYQHGIMAKTLFIFCSETWLIYIHFKKKLLFSSVLVDSSDVAVGILNLDERIKLLNSLNESNCLKKKF